MGQQCVTHSESALKRAKQMKDDYQQRIKMCADDEFMKDRNNAWLMDATERLNQDLKDLTQKLLEDALRKKTDSVSEN